MQEIKKAIFNWDGMANYYDDASVWSSYFGNLLLNEVHLKRNTIVLDIGCGTGFPSLEIAARIGQYGKVYALDPWEKGIEILKNRAKVREINNIVTLNEWAEKMPISDEFVDLIVSNNGISACKDKSIVLKECFRILKAKGEMIFTVLLPESMQEVNNIFFETLKSIGVKKDQIEKNQVELFPQRKTIQEYEKLFKNIGFAKRGIVTSNFEMEFLDGYSFINYYVFRMMFHGQWRKFVGKDQKDILLEKYAEKLDELAEKNGVLKLKIVFACIKLMKV